MSAWILRLFLIMMFSIGAISAVATLTDPITAGRFASGECRMTYCQVASR